MFKEMILTLCSPAINKKCLTKHVTRARTCPIDDQHLPDNWIAENLGELRVGAIPVVFKDILGAGVVNFVKAIEAAENIRNARTEAVELELELLGEEMYPERIV